MKLKYTRCNHKNNLITFCGIPASGKSTLARIITNEYNATLYSYDDLPNANLPSKKDEVRSNMWADILRDLKSGKTVVLDDLLTTKQMRKNMLDAISEVDCKKTIIVMQTPLDVCIQRNTNRKRRLPNQFLYSFHKRYEPPMLEEGFDEIIYHKYNEND